MDADEQNAGLSYENFDFMVPEHAFSCGYLLRYESKAPRCLVTWHVLVIQLPGSVDKQTAEFTTIARILVASLCPLLQIGA